MKRILIALLTLVSVHHSIAADKIVGGDLSLVPAYEKAGDKWLDDKGNVIEDLISYVHEQGWNCVRVRLFLNPTKDSDPATCQNYDYVEALGARIKKAGMKFMLDMHYSDTWADPGTQRIPDEWKGKTDKELSALMYSYTYDVITNLIAAGAAPDYVQLGNEITYGLLWRTNDGKYPSSSSDYAKVGYCPTWSATYSTGSSQWKRTASMLNNAAHAVHESFNNQGIDSTSVKLVVHTEMGNTKYNSDNFYKHLRTAGFTNYDVIGLSYYPFWHGTFSTLGTLLTTLNKDFPNKEVQIVETAWYNSYYPYSKDGNNEYSIASLNSSWTANANGLVNYLRDLVAKLKEYDQVTGVLYWEPEECGNGYSSKVMNGYLNRGMWKSSGSSRHNMLTALDGTTPVKALADYIASEDDNGETGNGVVSVDIEKSILESSGCYTISGTPCQDANSQGLYIYKGRKIVR